MDTLDNFPDNGLKLSAGAEFVLSVDQFADMQPGMAVQLRMR